VWLGLAKIGVVPALINNNLRQQALVHTIQVADCKGAIYGLEVESGEKKRQLRHSCCFGFIFLLRLSEKTLRLHLCTYLPNQIIF
jgi:hypothetical protein